MCGIAGIISYKSRVDETELKMMASAIAGIADSGYVLDGFPRTVNQAVELDKALACDDNKIDIVLNLQINDEIVLGRMTGRRSCPSCGAVYHVENLKPKVDGVCDIDGSKLQQRPDDEPEVVKNRLKTYHEQTEPVVGHYKNNSTVYDIDASENADVVSSLLFEKLDALAKV